MIDEVDLLKGSALDFDKQPYLRQLFRTVARERTTRLTFVVGAGISQDAGLPGWSGLIKNMCRLIEEPEMQELALSDEVDMLRKAEFVLQMVSERTGEHEDQIIGRALYGQLPSVTPGPSALAIARLGVSLSRRSDRARLLTTNFDEVLEVALQDYVAPTRIKSIRLDEEVLLERALSSDGRRTLKKWSQAPDPGVWNVLHAHGMVVPRRRTLEPLILNESKFLRYGPAVRSLITEELKTSCVIFIGLSVTDPNLTGPLWEMRGKWHGDHAAEGGRKPFLLTTPSSAGEQGTRYALQKARYLEEELQLRPIFLKSHSQLAQVLFDLDLAAHAPAEDYLISRRSRAPLVYGVRFQKKLDECYDAVGCDPTTDALLGQGAHSLSASLNALLTNRGSIGRMLRRFANRPPIKDLSDEHFGFFLWLRARAHGRAKASYALRLIGTSASTLSDSWLSPFRQVPIEPDSPYAVARAVFEGKYIVSNMSEQISAEIPYPKWRGVLAVPIRIESRVHCPDGNPKFGLDILTVGAIALGTTKPVVRLEAPKLPLRRKRTSVDPSMSLLATLEPEETAEFQLSLERCAQKLLGVGRPTTAAQS